MSDAEIRVYERALLRSGQDPNAVACGILGVDPKRFLLLVESLDVMMSDRAKKVHAASVYAVGQEAVRNLVAIPVTTLVEFIDWTKTLASRGINYALWDELTQDCIQPKNLAMIFNDVRDGWVQGTSPPYAHQLSVAFVDADGRETPPSGDVVSNPLTAVVHPQFRDQEPPYENDFD